MGSEMCIRDSTTSVRAKTQAVEITGPENGCRIAYKMVMDIASAPPGAPPPLPLPPSKARPKAQPPPHGRTSAKQHFARPSQQQQASHQQTQAYPYAAPGLQSQAPSTYGYGANGSGWSAQPTSYAASPAYIGHTHPLAPNGYGAVQAQQGYHVGASSPQTYATQHTQHTSAMPASQHMLLGQPSSHHQQAARPTASNQCGYVGQGGLHPQGTDGGIDCGNYSPGLHAGMAAVLSGNLPPDLASMILAAHQHCAAPSHANLQ